MSSPLYYIRNKLDAYLLPNTGTNWYHGNPTFTPDKSKAGLFTLEETNALLSHQRMHPKARREVVP